MSLDNQFDQWRTFVSRRPAISTDDVEEMEGHLRDQVADLTATGLSEDEAFLVAVKRMGSLDDISAEFAREHSDRLWKQLVLVGDDAPTARWGEIATMLGFAVAAALTLKLGIATLSEQRAVLNAALLVLPFLAAYLAWKRNAPPLALAAVAAVVVPVALALNLYPFEAEGMTMVLALLHAPVVLWFAVGLAYTGGDWRSARRRMDFVRFTGEWVIYMALLALGGGVLVGLTAAIFTAIDLDPEVALVEWIIPMGAAGAVVVAAWLVEAKQSVIENMAPVLTRVFSPLTVLLMTAVLGAFAIEAGLVDANRELLIVMALVLILVLGLWLYAVSARDPHAPAGVFEWVLLALLISAVTVDAVVLTAMLTRIAEFGATANKVAALGLNLVLLANLAWSARLCIGFVRGTKPFATIEKWQTDYLPAYGAWAVFVLIALPPLFDFV